MSADAAAPGAPVDHTHAYLVERAEKLTALALFAQQSLGDAKQTVALLELSFAEAKARAIAARAELEAFHAGMP